MIRSFAFLGSLVLSFMSTNAMAQEILGCWRFESRKITAADGSVSDGPVTPAVTFFTNTIRVLKSSNGQLISRLRYASPGRVFMQQVDNSGQLVGQSESEFSYSLSGNKLALISQGRPTQINSIYVRTDASECSSMSQLAVNLNAAQQPRTASPQGQAPKSVAIAPAQGGKYNAPDLLGFKIGMGPVEAIGSRISELEREGYLVTRKAVSDSATTSQIIYISKATNIPKPNVIYHTVETSYVILFIDRDSQIRTIARGEDFVNMPLVSDFTSALKAKLNPPAWASDALLRTGSTPQLGERPREPFWGVSKGQVVKLAECFLPNRGGVGMALGGFDRVEFRVPIKNSSGNFQTHHFEISESAFENLKPNACQYAVVISAGTAVYGPNQGDVIAGYAITITDMEKNASDGLKNQQRQLQNAEAERNRIRSSASRPKL